MLPAPNPEALIPNSEPQTSSSYLLLSSIELSDAKVSERHIRALTPTQLIEELRFKLARMALEAKRLSDKVHPPEP